MHYLLAKPGQTLGPFPNLSLCTLTSLGRATLFPHPPLPEPELDDPITMITELCTTIGPPSSLHLYTSPSELHLRADSLSVFLRKSTKWVQGLVSLNDSISHLLSSLSLFHLYYPHRPDTYRYYRLKQSQKNADQLKPTPLYTLDHIRRTKPKSTADSRDIG